VYNILGEVQNIERVLTIKLREISPKKHNNDNENQKGEEWIWKLKQNLSL
jgi:hypothetical protein